MRNLVALALRYRCDKAINHSYIRFYEDLLAEINVKNLLEIGIGYADLMDPFVKRYIVGASLYMWRDYLPAANIFTCDVREELLLKDIPSFRCDQTSAVDLRDMMDRIRSPLDVIIDDGSHMPEDQIFTANFLLPSLAPNGAYVIEDVREVEKVIAGIFAGPACKAGLKFGRTPDDNLVVIRK